MCGVHTLTFDMTTTETVTLRLVRLYHCPGPPVERKRVDSLFPTLPSAWILVTLAVFFSSFAASIC